MIAENRKIDREILSILIAGGQTTIDQLVLDVGVRRDLILAGITKLQNNGLASSIMIKLVGPTRAATGEGEGVEITQSISYQARGILTRSVEERTVLHILIEFQRPMEMVYLAWHCEMSEAAVLYAISRLARHGTSLDRHHRIAAADSMVAVSIKDGKRIAEYVEASDG